MCGILVIGEKKCSGQQPDDEKTEVLRDEILPFIHRRGPDGVSEHRVKFRNWKIDFCGSVLWMQGWKPVRQPVKDADGNILLWNGDIFDGSFIPEYGESDTQIVLRNIFGSNVSEDGILKSLSAVKGPYSLVYWSETSKKLWFGRDRIGRHSLLCCFQEDSQFILTSVGKSSVPFIEVPVIGIFVVDFSGDTYTLTVYPWSDISNEELALMQDFSIPINISNMKVTSPVVTKCPMPYEPTEEYFQCIKKSKLSKLSKSSCMFDDLLSNIEISTKVEQLLQCLRRAVWLRCVTHPERCRNCVIDINMDTILHSYENLTHVGCPHPKIGILFSGGLDSTVIAALAHECIPLDIPIDLFNVAFENCKRNTVRSHDVENSLSSKFNTPDRTTGIKSVEELQTIFSNRQWNFIQINVSRNELSKFRSAKMGDLIHPLRSVLDDSLGCALWFASGLNGILRDTEYKSPARVLLLGMGADEQFGGYMRHRTILRHKGWTALANEMNMELQRIATRNLGRDDRIVGDHGCQARFPFLDEDLVNFISSLPVWTRCYPTSELPPGVGDKLLLRVAAWKLGLQKAALFPKRAFQFGSRIANSKEKACDISSTLK